MFQENRNFLSCLTSRKLRKCSLKLSKYLSFSSKIRTFQPAPGLSILLSKLHLHLTFPWDPSQQIFLKFLFCTSPWKYFLSIHAFSRLKDSPTPFCKLCFAKPGTLVAFLCVTQTSWRHYNELTWTFRKASYGGKAPRKQVINCFPFFRHSGNYISCLDLPETEYKRNEKSFPSTPHS